MSDEEWKNCGLTYKVAHDTKWLLIFHHEVSEGKFSRETAAFNLKKNKFSYISRISDPHYVNRFNESYEFLLEYPEFPGQYNRWIQDKDPMSEWDSNITGTKASGFSPVNLSWKDNFGGLMRDHYNSSLLNGQTGSYLWHYAIGDWSSFYIDQEGVTPGITFNTDEYGGFEYKMVKSIFLWIRIHSIICNLCTKMRYYPILSQNIFISLLFPFYFE